MCLSLILLPALSWKTLEMYCTYEIRLNLILIIWLNLHRECQFITAPTSWKCKHALRHQLRETNQTESGVPHNKSLWVTKRKKQTNNEQSFFFFYQHHYSKQVTTYVFVPLHWALEVLSEGPCRSLGGWQHSWPAGPLPTQSPRSILQQQEAHVL